MFPYYSPAQQNYVSPYCGNAVVGRSLSTMNKNEIIQQKKNEALNKIRKIFHPLTENHYDQYSGESYAEQREYMARYIIETLEKELEALKKQGVS